MTFWPLTLQRLPNMFRSPERYVTNWSLLTSISDPCRFIDHFNFIRIQYIFCHQQDVDIDAKGNEIVPNLPPPKVQKVDLAALFTARQLPMSDNECVSILVSSISVLSYALSNKWNMCCCFFQWRYWRFQCQEYFSFFDKAYLVEMVKHNGANFNSVLKLKNLFTGILFE